jgi:LPXTG-motif cell wall-anchored protein
VVTNNGTELLQDIVLEDDQLGLITCPQDTLVPRQAMTCTATGPAEINQHENIATVTALGVPPEAGVAQVVTDTDPSHYFGFVSAIDILKLANGEDANELPGITVPPGSNVTMTFIVTNPGNVPILDVEVTDDQGLVPTFVDGDTNADGNLDPTETWTYEAVAGPASGSNLNNIGTVTALDLLENPLTDNDPANVTTTPVQPIVDPLDGGGGGGSLPATGADSFPLLLLALALIVSGTGMLAARRRFAR